MFQAYHRFLLSSAQDPAESFFKKLMDGWGVDLDLALLVTKREILAVHKERPEALAALDEALCGLAFSQLLLEGRVENWLVKQAVMALRRIKICFEDHDDICEDMVYLESLLLRS